MTPAARPAVAALLVAALLAATGCGQTSSPTAAPKTPVRAASKHRPNVVFVLTDDLAWNLVRYMPHVRRMQKHGLTFRNYYVTDSLCCPSRSSIFSGRFPHNTRVLTNRPPDGGFEVFHGRGEENATFATRLRSAGYGTALMGKYLNGYFPRLRVDGSERAYVPPGWTEWDVAGEGYAEFDYRLNSNHVIQPYGHAPADYLTDVIAGKGVDFVRTMAAARQPFVLELSTFAPHHPYTPAPRDANRFPGVRAPRPRSFNRHNVNAPSWLARVPPLSGSEIQGIDSDFRLRVQSVQAIDRMLANVEHALKKAGVADDTYIVFSSDNGYHMGEHRLLPGKMTAFDSDIRVPLIVTGPGVPAGRTDRRMVQNVDLAPTFARLARTRMSSSIDGRSLVPLLHHQHVKKWRKAVLVEHVGPVAGPDPDAPPTGDPNPPTYEALRLPHAVYVEYADGTREYYDLKRDRYERHNTWRLLRHKRRSRLHRTLLRLERCSGQRSCWSAASRVR